MPARVVAATPASSRVRAYADNAIDGSVDLRATSTTNQLHLGGETASTTRRRSIAHVTFRLPKAGRPRIVTPPARPDRRQEPAPLLEADGHGHAGVGHNVPSAHYWVTIARDANFTTIVQQAYTDEPCWAPSKPMVDEGTLYYWQVIPTTTRRQHYNGDVAGAFRRLPDVAELPARVGAADADLAGRRRGGLGLGRVPLVDRCRSRSRTTRSRSRRTTRSRRSSSRPRPTPRRTPRRRPTRSARRSTGACA